MHNCLHCGLRIAKSHPRKSGGCQHSLCGGHKTAGCVQLTRQQQQNRKAARVAAAATAASGVGAATAAAGGVQAGAAGAATVTAAAGGGASWRGGGCNSGGGRGVPQASQEFQEARVHSQVASSCICVCGQDSRRSEAKAPVKPREKNKKSGPAGFRMKINEHNSVVFLLTKL